MANNYNTTLQSNNSDLQTVLQILQTKAAGGEQATPVISVSSNGLIIATAGTKTSTKQLAFQEANTITPFTLSQVAVPSGYYTRGDIIVAGDSNLVAGNIKSGVSIFGVNGKYEGEAAAMVNGEFITRTITTCADDKITTIGSYAFAYCSKLTTASFPMATTISNHAFYYCSTLTSVSFPAATTIGALAFYGCSKLTTASFPMATTIYNDAFCNCSDLSTASFPNVETIYTDAFCSCYMLTSVSFPNVKYISGSAFRACSKLTRASFPMATTIGSNAFRDCIKLTTASFPMVSHIGDSAFCNCSMLTSVSFPMATTISSYAFYGCSKLTTASFPAATTISTYVFNQCFNLTKLYLTGSRVCTLAYSGAFNSTPIGGYSASAGTYGSIYVPASLLTSYKTATNWVYFSSRFAALTHHSGGAID